MQIILENADFRLTVGSDAIARSLTIKETGEECLNTGEEIALFSVTQERPFNNEVKLAHPNKRTTFQANRLRREGNRLIVGFEITPFEAVIEVKETDACIGFQLTDFIVHPTDYEHLSMATPPVFELRVMQLPVKNRKNFGEWLNVSWDDRAAVCLMGTSPHARIDSERRKGYRILTADAVRDVRLKNTGAVLIACPPDRLLDAIAQVEEDYDLPKGVRGRRNPLINASAYWSMHVTPDNVDEHIRYAKMGGFRLMLLYYTCMFKYGYSYDTCGDYDWRDEYPNGRKDLEKMIGKIKAAGITPGLHFLHTHIGIKSRYVTPVADHRLNKTRRFTLSRPLDQEADILYVEQNPEGTVLVDRCRVLQFGGELIGYEGYTAEPPYAFTGCTRGLYDTVPCAQPMGMTGGLIDVSEFGHGHSFYLDQNSSLQDEVADKLADAYNAGFEFVYFDGSEGTNAPFEYHVPNAQYRVWKKMNSEPMQAEGAAKSHFSWHMLSGGNAFDIFPPSTFKQNICRYPLEEAPRMRCDFTRLNFGWWGFWSPGNPDGDVTGTQPDMYEFGTSRAAAWDCPITVQSNMEAFCEHPRTPDILEVMRRWEDVRAKNWLTEEQKLALRSETREHMLWIDENGEYELVECEQIASAPVRAFLFERKELRYAAYWHVGGSGELKLPLPASGLTLQDELGAPELPVRAEGECAVLPADRRRYLSTSLSKEELIAAFCAAECE